MGHNNYSKFSKRNNQAPEQHQHTIDVPSYQNEEMPVHQHPINPVVEEVKQLANGRVFDCEQLYVRKEGKKESDVLCIIEKDSEVQINLDESTEEFYKVVTPSGIEGYCMKKFIEVK